MGLIINPRYATLVFALLWLGASLPAPATPIYPDSMPPTATSDLSLEEKRLYTMSLMEMSPLRTDRPITIPELTNPLALDKDTLPKIFGINIYFADLLATPQFSKYEKEPVELPEGALQGVDILDNMDALFLSYDGRAYDKSILDIGKAEIVDKHGLPVTTDGTPLSLIGFGKIIRSNIVSESLVAPRKDEAEQP